MKLKYYYFSHSKYRYISFNLKNLQIFTLFSFVKTIEYWFEKLYLLNENLYTSKKLFIMIAP